MRGSGAGSIEPEPSETPLKTMKIDDGSTRIRGCPSVRQGSSSRRLEETGGPLAESGNHLVQEINGSLWSEGSLAQSLELFAVLQDLPSLSASGSQ